MGREEKNEEKKGKRKRIREERKQRRRRQIMRIVDVGRGLFSPLGLNDKEAGG